MKLSEFKKHLGAIKQLNFILPNGSFVPQHFHITEMGLIDKQFIDCGGSLRHEKTVCMQVWCANDTEHRLSSDKLKKIVDKYEKLFGSADYEAEVEYQLETIGRYGLEFENNNFLLLAKQTNCLAKDNCGIPEEKQKLRLSELQNTGTACCTPGGGCC